MLLAEQEPSRIRWRLADFYEAAIDARTARSDSARRHDPDLVAGNPGRPHRTRRRMPAPKGSTGSSSRSNGPVNRPSGLGQVMGRSGVSRLRRSMCRWRLAMSRACRATSLSQPRSRASSWRAWASAS